MLLTKIEMWYRKRFARYFFNKDNVIEVLAFYEIELEPIWLELFDSSEKLSSLEASVLVSLLQRKIGKRGTIQAITGSPISYFLGKKIVLNPFFAGFQITLIGEE
jgi:hypothetical protein